MCEHRIADSDTGIRPRSHQVNKKNPNCTQSGATHYALWDQRAYGLTVNDVWCHDDFVYTSTTENNNIIFIFILIHIIHHRWKPTLFSAKLPFSFFGEQKKHDWKKEYTVTAYSTRKKNTKQTIAKHYFARSYNRKREKKIAYVYFNNKNYTYIYRDVHIIIMGYIKYAMKP